MCRSLHSQRHRNRVTCRLIDGPRPHPSESRHFSEISHPRKPKLFTSSSQAIRVLNTNRHLRSIHLEPARRTAPGPIRSARGSQRLTRADLQLLRTTHSVSGSATDLDRLPISLHGSNARRNAAHLSCEAWAVLEIRGNASHGADIFMKKFEYSPPLPHLSLRVPYRQDTGRIYRPAIGCELNNMIKGMIAHGRDRCPSTGKFLLPSRGIDDWSLNPGLSA